MGPKSDGASPVFLAGFGLTELGFAISPQLPVCPCAGRASPLRTSGAPTELAPCVCVPSASPWLKLWAHSLAPRDTARRTCWPDARWSTPPSPGRTTPSGGGTRRPRRPARGSSSSSGWRSARGSRRAAATASPPRPAASALVSRSGPSTSSPPPSASTTSRSTGRPQGAAPLWGSGGGSGGVPAALVQTITRRALQHRSRSPCTQRMEDRILDDHLVLTWLARRAAFLHSR